MKGIVLFALQQPFCAFAVLVLGRVGTPFSFFSSLATWYQWFCPYLVHLTMVFFLSLGEVCVGCDTITDGRKPFARRVLAYRSS